MFTATAVCPLFDPDNAIFLVAVEGPPTADNLASALAVLALAPADPLDVRAIAFKDSQVPLALQRMALSALGVSVINRPGTALEACRKFRDDILQLANSSLLATSPQAPADR